MLDIQNQFKYTVSLKQKKIMDFFLMLLSYEIKWIQMCVYLSINLLKFFTSSQKHLADN